MDPLDARKCYVHLNLELAPGSLYVEGKHSEAFHPEQSLRGPGTALSHCPKMFEFHCLHPVAVHVRECVPPLG